MVGIRHCLRVRNDSNGVLSGVVDRRLADGFELLVQSEYVGGICVVRPGQPRNPGGTDKTGWLDWIERSG